MTKLAEIFSEIIHLNQKTSVLGFKPLDEYIQYSTGISVYFVPYNILEKVKEKINIKIIKSFTDLGSGNYCFVTDYASLKTLDWNEIANKNSRNKFSSVIIVAHDCLSDKGIDSQKGNYSLMVRSNFVASILNDSLEMVILKNRYGHNGKIQLNLDNKYLLDILDYTPSNFNIIVGSPAKYKTTVMNTILKNYLEKGARIAYVGSLNDLNRLMRDLSPNNPSTKLSDSAIKDFIDKYNEQLSFHQDFINIDQNRIVFVEEQFCLQFSSHLPEMKNLNNSEIWLLQNKDRSEQFDFYKMKYSLETSSRKVKFLNLNISSKKIIIESLNQCKAFYPSLGLVNLNVFVNLLNYTSLLQLDLEIQEINNQLSNLTQQTSISYLDMLNNLNKLKDQKLKLLKKDEE